MVSPITSNMGIPSCSVIVGGKDVGAKYGLKSVIVTKEINKVSKARIIVMDGDLQHPPKYIEHLVFQNFFHQKVS